MLTSNERLRQAAHQIMADVIAGVPETGVTTDDEVRRALCRVKSTIRSNRSVRIIHELIMAGG